MMPDPNAYADYLRGMDAHDVLMEQRRQRKMVGQFKDLFRYGMDEVFGEMCPGYDVQLEYAREYMYTAAKVYLEKAGDTAANRKKVYTREDVKDMTFQASIPRILRITCKVDYTENGEPMVCEYTADFSVDPVVTFRSVRRAGSRTRVDKQFRLYQAQQSAAASLPERDQKDSLLKLRNEMLNLRPARVNDQWENYYLKNLRQTLLASLSRLHIGEWQSHYPFEAYEENFSRAAKTYIRYAKDYSSHDEETYAMYMSRYDELFGKPPVRPEDSRSWKIMVDFRSDLLYPGRNEKKADRLVPVASYVFTGKDNVPYNMDALCALLDFNDKAFRP